MEKEKYIIVILSIITISWLGWIAYRLNASDNLRASNQRVLVGYSSENNEGRV